jgi:hypothetical protein
MLFLGFPLTFLNSYSEKYNEDKNYLPIMELKEL